jgi:hypothetical protein
MLNELFGGQTDLQQKGSVDDQENSKRWGLAVKVFVLL